MRNFLHAHAWVARAQAVAFFAASVMACSSGGGAPAGGPGGVASDDPEAFFAAWKQKYCDALTPCCLAGGVYHDPASCKTWYSGSQISKAVSMGIAFDGGMAATCLRELDTWYASCSNWGPGPDSCNHVFRGTVPAGGACTIDAECASPATGQATCLGDKCQVEAVVPAAGSCGIISTSITNVCGAGSYCPRPTDGATSTCVAHAEVGAACTERACVPDAYCDPTTTKCIRRLAAGGPCTETAQCERSAFCDGTACVPKKQLGESCTQDAQCYAGCLSGVCGASGTNFRGVPYGQECIY